MKRLMYFSFVFLWLLNTSVYASSDAQVAKIVSSKTMPVGVVFEIVSTEDGLNWALPKIKQYVKALRKKHPKIKIAVVSHGKELFALQAKHKKKYQQIHSLTKGLVANDNVTVHVCETYARNSGIEPEAFPKHISISTQGPTEIKNYQEFGYIKIILTK